MNFVTSNQGVAHKTKYHTKSTKSQINKVHKRSTLLDFVWQSSSNPWKKRSKNQKRQGMNWAQAETAT